MNHWYVMEKDLRQIVRLLVSYPTQKMDLQEDPDSARTMKPGRGQKNQK